VLLLPVENASIPGAVTYAVANQKRLANGTTLSLSNPTGAASLRVTSDKQLVVGMLLLFCCHHRSLPQPPPPPSWSVRKRAGAIVLMN